MVIYCSSNRELILILIPIFLLSVKGFLYYEFTLVGSLETGECEDFALESCLPQVVRPVSGLSIDCDLYLIHLLFSHSPVPC